MIPVPLTSRDGGIVRFRKKFEDCLFLSIIDGLARGKKYHGHDFSTVYVSTMQNGFAPPMPLASRLTGCRRSDRRGYCDGACVH